MSTKRHYFLIILWTITVIGLILFLSSWIPFFTTLPKEFSPYITEYIKIWGWVLLVSGILWILLLWSEAEKSLKLEDFLETWGNKEFTRHDFVKFVYGKEIETTDNRYKGIGTILRRAQNEWIITETNPGKNPRIYKTLIKDESDL